MQGSLQEACDMTRLNIKRKDRTELNDMFHVEQ